MFGSKTNRKENSTSRSSGVNTLSEGTQVSGDISASDDIRIDGRLKGNLHCDARVIIGSTGFIDGNITCHQAVIEGEVKGEIFVEDLISLLDSARITGSIRARKLAVGAGCIINGLCTVTGMSAEVVEARISEKSYDMQDQKMLGGVVAVAG